MRNTWLKLVVLVFLLITCIGGQAPQDPFRDFCRRYGHQTAVIDRRMYIDGGWIYANPISQNPIPVMNQRLLYTNLDESSYSFPTPYDNLRKDSGVPNVAGGTLWADNVNKIFWLYGGESPTPPLTAFQLWSYDTITDQWVESSTNGDVAAAAYGAGVSVTELGKGYYYGGYLGKLSVPGWTGPSQAVSNMIIFDMDENTLTNTTGLDGLARAEGVLVYLPTAGSGLLVYFGGVYFPYDNRTEAPMPLSDILIYNIGDASWHVQTATGDIPPNRRKFCAGATWAQDQSSYQIFLYGGFGFAENVTGYDDVYILSLPTFEWVKWYPEPGASIRPHGDMTCNVIENAQMIKMGGNFSADDDCDTPNTFGQHNLNLGQDNVNRAKWYQFLPNLKSYLVPDAIISMIGGSPAGSARRRIPVNGFNDPAISSYFQSKAVYATRTPTRSLVPIQPSNPFQSKEKMGAIIGGSVGGGIALIIAFFTMLFCLIKRTGTRGRLGVASTSSQTMTYQMHPSSSDAHNKQAGVNVIVPSRLSLDSSQAQDTTRTDV